MDAEAAADTLEHLSAAYLEAIVAGRRARALDIVLRLGRGSGHSVETLALRVVMQAQAEVGRLWEENRISIADEHVATAISERVLASLYATAERQAPNGISVVIACVEGELHDMGARVLADLLDLHGFDVLYAGASLPTASLVDLCRKARPDLVGLSVTMAFNVPSLRGAVRELRAALPDVKIAAGGEGFRWHPGLAGELNLFAFGRDAREAIANVRRAFAK